MPVNKEWSAYINSLQGTRAILKEFLDSKKVLSFFQNTLKIYNQEKSLQFQITLTTAEQSIIFLILLATHGAQILLQEIKDKGTPADETIRRWVKVLIEIIVRNKDKGIINNSQYGELLLTTLSSLKKFQPQNWISLLSLGLIGNIVAIFIKTEKKFFPEKLAAQYKKIFLNDFNDLIEYFNSTRARVPQNVELA